MIKRMIYLDMDEVVADFKGWAQTVLRAPVESVSYPPEEWRKLKQHQRLYSQLPLKEGAHELVSWVTRYAAQAPLTEVAFLSAIPKNNDMPYCAQDKVWWADRHFRGIPVFLGPYSSDKQRYCLPGDILIDDRAVNGAEWLAAGGLWHQYRNWPDCRLWLEKTLGPLTEP